MLPFVIADMAGSKAEGQMDCCVSNPHNCPFLFISDYLHLQEPGRGGLRNIFRC